MSAKEPDGFGQAREAAERLSRDKRQVGYLVEEAIARAERHRKRLEKVWANLQTLLRMVRASLKGEYPRVPWQTMIFAVAAIVYFVNPFDLIPDFLPGSGFLDDATVIGFVVKMIKNDLDEFLNWEQAADKEQ